MDDAAVRSGEGFAQPGAGLFTHPGGVIGGPFPFEWVTPPLGSAPADWSWPVEALGPFAEAPGDAPEFPWLAEVPDDVPGLPWLGEEPEEDLVGAVVGDEAVVVVDGLVPEWVDEGAVVVVVPAVVVELPEEGAVVVAEPSPGAEAAGAEVVPTGEVGAPASGALGGLTAAGFTEIGAASEDGSVVLAATIGGAPAGAAAATPGVGPGWVAPARGSEMPDTSG